MFRMNHHKQKQKQKEEHAAPVDLPAEGSNLESRRTPLLIFECTEDGANF